MPWTSGPEFRTTNAPSVECRQRGRRSGLIQPGQTCVRVCDDASGNHDRDQRGDGDRR